MGIAIYKSDMYWVDRNLRSVFKASKLLDNSSVPVRVRTNLEKLRDIVIFDITNQPMDETNPCKKFGNGGCEQLCFPLPADFVASGGKTHVCDCATGKLASDGKVWMRVVLEKVLMMNF